MQARRLQTRRKKMTTVFEGSPKFGGISGDYARVTVVDDRVLIQ